MELWWRLDERLERILDELRSEGCPPRLAAALRHALLPGGKRLRPRLCLAVAQAVGASAEAAAERAAVAVEILHCASLVHDDLPCFDDAAVRRGRASVHRVFGEPLAVLAGDALIVTAFREIALVQPASLASALMALMVRAGAAMAAGQAWESEPGVELQAYHRNKTASLFEAAARAGALVAGDTPERWTDFGRSYGEAYQIADDLADALDSEEALGKPAGRDGELGRPSAVRALGVSGSSARLRRLYGDTLRAIPPCPGEDALREHVRATLAPSRLP